MGVFLIVIGGIWFIVGFFWIDRSFGIPALGLLVAGLGVVINWGGVVLAFVWLFFLALFLKFGTRQYKVWWEKWRQEKEQWRKIDEKIRNPPPLSNEEIIKKIEQEIDFASTKGWSGMKWVLTKVQWFYKHRLLEEKFMEKYRELPSDDDLLSSMNEEREDLNERKGHVDNFIEVEGMPRTQREVYDELTQKAKSNRDFTTILMKMETEEWREQLRTDTEVPEEYRRKKELEERELREQEEATKAAKIKKEREILTKKQAKIKKWMDNE